jgi:carboxypeptidase Taq
MVNANFDELSKQMKELRYLSTSQSMLFWDMRTYMPSEGIEQRGQTLSILGKIIHEKATKKQIGELISQCNKSDSGLDEIQKRNVELWKRDYERETKLPSDLVVRLTKQSTITEHKWQEAKQKQNFGMVKPDLEKLVELIRERAQALDAEKPMYDVLLDEYEPKMTAAGIRSYFTPLKEGVIKLIKKYQDAVADNPPNISVINKNIPVDQQKQVSKWIMNFLGMPPTRSRVDEAEHPFTTGLAKDVRITTHYLDNDPTGAIYSTFHEGGHALYELNTSEEHWFTGVGETVSMGIHESQSRFCENIVGKNSTFLKYFYPNVVQKYMPAFNSLDTDTFIKSVNAIIPSKIRIYADEVTYNLHVILRFEIEQDLITGKISVAELPDIWNAKMEEYLGVKVENDSEGVLQDTHWYAGLIGYFPTYVLGNIYNSQMLFTMKKSNPEWEDQLAIGDFSKIRTWLVSNVQNKGSIYDPIDLIKNICNQPPDTKYFLDYLNEKYKYIYNI